MIKILLVLCFFNLGHRCKWELCPYKGIKKSEWRPAVDKFYKCQEGKDPRAIDFLHLLRPRWSKERVYNALFND